MKKINTLILITILSIPPLFSSTQTLKLTLQDSIKLAMENNPEILQEKAKLKSAKQLTNISYSALLPKLDLSAYKVLDEKVMTISMPPLFPGMPAREIQMDFTKNYQLTLQFIQPIFTGGKIFFSIKSSEALKSAQKALLKAKEYEVKAKVKSIFFSILLLEETKNTVSNAKKTAMSIRTTIKTMLEQGLSKKLDYLMAENKVRELEVKEKEIESNIFEAKNNLKNLLGLNESVKIQPVGSIKEVFFNLNENQLKEILLSQNQLLKALNENENSAKYKLKSGYSDFLPQIAVAGQYNMRGDELSNFSDWDDYYSVNLTLSLNLFSGFSRISRIALLKAQKEELEIKKEALKKEFISQLKNSIKENSYLRDKVKTYKKNYENSKLQLEIAKESYNQGLISYIELENAENSYLNAKTLYFQSIYEYYINIFKIESLLSYEIFK